MEEKLILVNVYDREIGTEEKLKAHEKGLLHRAFSIFIHDGNKLLIQKRQEDKYHSGGLWANACCSHPRQGESLGSAIHRRLQEEMGFDCQLSKQFSFIYRAEFKNGLTEYEYDHVFLGEYSGEVTPNPDEASEICWITFDELEKELLEQPEKFCSWFLIAAPKILSILTDSIGHNMYVSPE